ncbi:preprotein translocase subunit SecG, partial [Planctomycetota bacterium]
MNVLPLLAAIFVMKLVMVLFIFCSVVLILVILLQKGRGGGLSAAFGGGMGGGLLGSKTGDFLTWVTIVLVSVFLILAVVMAKFYKPTVSDFGQSGADGQTLPAGTTQTGPSAQPTSTELPGGQATIPGADESCRKRGMKLGMYLSPAD